MEAALGIMKSFDSIMKVLTAFWVQIQEAHQKSKISKDDYRIFWIIRRSGL